jgi:hypothetical protein
MLFLDGACVGSAGSSTRFHRAKALPGSELNQAGHTIARRLARIRSARGSGGQHHHLHQLDVDVGNRVQDGSGLAEEQAR